MAKVSKNRSDTHVEDFTLEVTRRMRHLLGVENLRYIRPVHMNADQPLVIPLRKGGSGEVTNINAPLIGSLIGDNGENYVDMTKNALRLARAASHDAVIITGGLSFVLTKRYGTTRPYQTQVSGVTLDPASVEAEYPESVKKDKRFDSIAKRMRMRKPIFISIKTRVDHVIEMIRETFCDSRGRAIYDGPVYISFGKREDELIMFFTNEILRIALFEARTWAQNTVELHRAQLKNTDSKNKSARKAIEKKIKDFKEFLDIFLTMSNISDQSINEARQIATAYLIKKYEEAIPNSKVISLGDGFVQFDGRLIMITTNKDHEGYNGRLAKELVAKTEGYSKGRDSHTIPSVMLGAGLNPLLDAKLLTYQGSDDEGDKRVCLVVQLPICVDSDRFRGIVRDQNVLKDPLTKVALKGGFESGIVTLSFHPGFALPVLRPYLSPFLKSAEIFRDAKSLKRAVSGREYRFRTMFFYKNGCTHYGAGDVLTYPGPDGYQLYHDQVARRLLLACGAPILMHLHDGDISQQYNHPYVRNVHPKAKLPEDILDYLRALEARTDISDGQKFILASRMLHEQRILLGVLQIDEQIEGYVKSLRDDLEYFVKILERSLLVGMNFKGSISAITHIMGNHNKNTFKETEVYSSDARHITGLLQRDVLDYLIKTDRYHLRDWAMHQIGSFQNGPLGEARGSISVVSSKIEGAQSYAVVLKHKQGDMDSTQKRAKRRSINGVEFGLPILNLSGDDHKGGFRVTRGIVHLKTGGQQGEGSYGREIDGSEQNVFSAVLGVPVGGFACGPLTLVVLDEETARRYAASPFPIDRKRLFRNPLE